MRNFTSKKEKNIWKMELFMELKKNMVISRVIRLQGREKFSWQYENNIRVQRGAKTLCTKKETPLRPIINARGENQNN